MKATYWSVEVQVVELFGYYALVRYRTGESCIVLRGDLQFEGQTS